MGTAKQNQNRKKFTREYKVKEIQRSITKKTRLRKEYLKALKDEGYAVPEKEPKTVAKESVRKIKEARAIEGKKKLTQRTRTGQPLMGPKIEDLLDKIKTDDTYTS